MKRHPPLAPERKTAILGEEKPLAITALWKQSPPQLINLWDMIDKFILQQFAFDWELLCATLKHYDYWNSAAPGTYPKTEDQKNLVIAIGGAMRQCRLLDLPVSLDRSERFFENSKHGRCTFSTIHNELKNLSDSMKSELGARMLLFVPSVRSAFFEHDALFGLQVNDSFPSAGDDIKMAGNCLAVDLNTSAIFHLMRVVEIGLRALAKRERVKVKRGPINHAEWGEIIFEIEIKLKAAIPKTRGPKRAEALAFASGVLGEFKGFKDVWRNHVSHSRKSYEHCEALKVYFKVCDFMQRLSAKVRERLRSGLERG